MRYSMPTTPRLLLQSPHPRPTFTQILAANIRALCEGQGINSAMLSRLSGISYQTTRRIYLGKRAVMMDEFFMIQAALDVSFSDLLAGTEERYRKVAS